jgi:integrase
MGRRSLTGGVVGKGNQRIQFDFRLNGVRYRPTLRMIPTEANLRRARERLTAIKERIRLGTFSFIEEFPDFRDWQKVSHHSPFRTCNQVFDQYLAHCESRLAKNDLSFATVRGYRKALDSAWRPRLGALPFLKVQYSLLVTIANANQSWGKKTYNNKLSALRRAFDFGYRDHPEHINPARSLKGARMRRKDFPKIDPFRIQDAEALIETIHKDWGEAQGNFHEFRFFTGLRPSEEIALRVRDFEEAPGTLSVTKARVFGIDKNTTKTHEDRAIELCPRAIAILKRQLALRQALIARGRIEHDQLFFNANGSPIRRLGHVARCWRQSLDRLGLRFRRPYCARHTSVSWNLMIGKSPLWVSRQHGHRVATMFSTYAAWMDGALESDIAIIEVAMNRKQCAAELIAQKSREKSAVARLGTRLATGERPEVQKSPENKPQKKWRRGWDSNPRAGITRPSDFESAPL